MNWLRIALAILYCAAPISWPAGQMRHERGSIAAPAHPVAEVSAPTATGLGLSALLESRFTTVGAELQPDGIRLRGPALAGTVARFAAVSPSSPYTVQSVPCTLLSVSDLLPYDATAPPLVL